MTNRDDIVFWAQRWREARRMCKQFKVNYYGIADVAMLNYGEMLTETFSYMMDRNTKGVKNV